MQTQLLISNNNDYINSYINSLISKFQINQFNLIKIVPETSIGIEHVRTLKNNLILKPFAGQNRLVVIYDFHKATVEAQNALLKLFEEPPEKTIILAVSPTLANILPTIISRCKFIHEIPDIKFKPNIVDGSDELLVKIINTDSARRLLLAAEIAKSRESAMNFLKQLQLCLSKLLVEKSFQSRHSGLSRIDSGVSFGKLSFPRMTNTYKSTVQPLSLSDIAKLIKKVEGAIKYIEKNVNYKGVMDILFLGFPQKHA